MLIHSDTVDAISNACRLKIEICEGRLSPSPMDDQISLKGCRRVCGACFHNEAVSLFANRSHGRVEPDVDACCVCGLNKLVRKVRVEPDQRVRASVQNASLGAGTGGKYRELTGNAPPPAKHNSPRLLPHIPPLRPCRSQSL